MHTGLNLLVMKDKDVVSRKFGKHLKKLRTKKEVSAAELARRCFLEKSYISSVESGLNNPTLYTLYKFADALGITIEELFEGFE